MFTIFPINVVNHAAHYFEILNLHYEYIYFLLIPPQSVPVYNTNIAYTTHSVIYIWNLWFKKTTTSNAIVLQCSHQDHFKDQLSWFLLLLQTSHDQDHFQHQLSWLLLLPQTFQGCFQLPSHSSAMTGILTCWSCFLLTDVSIGV